MSGIPAIFSTLCVGSIILRHALAKAPHVVVFLVDDLGWNDVAGFAGNDTNIHMPNLQQYVREGVELQNFHTFRFCSPTRSSLMTARYPYHMGQQTNMNLNPAATIACGIPLNYSFLPELLQQKAPEENKPRSLFLGKWHLGFFKSDYIPTRRGFDRALGFTQGGETHSTHVAPYGHVPLWWQPENNDTHPEHNVLIDLFNNSRGAPFNPLGHGLNNTYSADLYASEFENVVSQHDPSVPLFVYYSNHDVHVPFEAPQRLYDLYEGVIQDEVRRVYAAMMTATDEAFGRMTRALAARGMLEDTVIMMMSDNGGNTKGCGADKRGGNNWPLRGAKFTHWRGGTTVPAFAWAGSRTGLLPESRRGSIYEHQLHAVDVYPTIAKMYGVSDQDLKESGPLPPDGVDFWPAVSGASGIPARNETVINVWTLGDGTLTGALVQGDYRLYMGFPGTPDDWGLPSDQNASEPVPPAPKGVYVSHGIRRIPCGPDTETADSSGDAPFGGGSGSGKPSRPCDESPCLFNVKEDPGEHNDIASQHPDIVKAMVTRMKELQKSEVSVEASGLCPSPPPGHSKWPDSYDSTYKTGFWQPWCDGL